MSDLFKPASNEEIKQRQIKQQEEYINDFEELIYFIQNAAQDHS